MRHRIKKIAFSTFSTLAAVLAAGAGAFAQINLTSANNTYTQNFDTLASTGATVTYTDNSTILGLYARQFGGTAAGMNAPPANYTVGTGSSATGALYSFGSAGSTDRALGSVGSGTFGGAQYGFRFVNTDPTRTLTGFNITYTGEQWRNGGNATAQPLLFSYAVFGSGAGDIGNETMSTTTGYAIDPRYTAFDALTFMSPTNISTAAALDGNAAANRTTLTAGTNNLLVGVNQELWVRFTDLNDTGNDHGLSADDFTLTAIFGGAAATPEPGTLALLGTIVVPGMGLLAARRRAKKAA